MRELGRLESCCVTDRVQEVGLAETDTAADEHRIVLRRVARRSGLRRGERELVRWTCDERVERVARIERRDVGRGAGFVLRHRLDLTGRLRVDRSKDGGRLGCGSAWVGAEPCAIAGSIDPVIAVRPSSSERRRAARSQENRLEPDADEAVGRAQAKGLAVPRR